MDVISHTLNGIAISSVNYTDYFMMPNNSSKNRLLTFIFSFIHSIFNKHFLVYQVPGAKDRDKNEPSYPSGCHILVGKRYVHSYT